MSLKFENKKKTKRTETKKKKKSRNKLLNGINMMHWWSPKNQKQKPRLRGCLVE